jgi:hypothetical protein
VNSKNEPFWRRIFNWFRTRSTMGFIERRPTSGQDTRSEVPATLKAGAAILNELMRSHGFAFSATTAGADFAKHVQHAEA